MSAVLDPLVIQKYSLGPVKAWVQKAAYFLGPRHGVTTIYGWRATDEFPDHPSGHAIDLMIKNLDQGTAIAQDAINNHVALGITGKSYLIFNRRVWNDHQGWHPYTSTSNPHTDHVHITMWNAGTGVPGGDIPGSIGGATPAQGAVDGTTDGTTYTCAWRIGSTCVLTKTAVRDVVGVLAMAAGLVVGITGLILLGSYAMNMTDGSIGDTLEWAGVK